MRSSPILLVAAVVIAAAVGFPIDAVVRPILVTLVLVCTLAVLVGATRVLESLFGWVVGLGILAIAWQPAAHQIRLGIGGATMPHSGTGIGYLGALLAAWLGLGVVLLLAAKVSAALPTQAQQRPRLRPRAALRRPASLPDHVRPDDELGILEPGGPNAT